MSVNLVKGQKVSLDKSAGAELRSVRMGLGWDVTPGAGQVDLDASCALYDANKQLLEQVWFGNKRTRDATVQHSGDNLTGKGDGDDESILVELYRVAPNVQSIVFAVTSFRGQRFNIVANAYVRVVNTAGDVEVCRYNLTGGADATALIMARLYRHNGEWKLAAIGEPANGKTIADLHGAIANVL